MVALLFSTVALLSCTSAGTKVDRLDLLANLVEAKVDLAEGLVAQPEYAHLRPQIAPNIPTARAVAEAFRLGKEIDRSHLFQVRAMGEPLRLLLARAGWSGRDIDTSLMAIGTLLDIVELSLESQ